MWPPAQKPIPDRIITRVWDHVDTSDATGCWLWTRTPGNHGYGEIEWDTKGEPAGRDLVHRVVWAGIHGLIPEGMTVDHVCRQRQCCNPAHLRLLTNAENASEPMSSRTHCKNGHEFTPANVWIRGDRNRVCRACKRINDRKYYRAKRT